MKTMQEWIVQTAKEIGFSRVYFLAPVPLPSWRERAMRMGVKTDGLEDDPAAAYPWARCILLLVWGYAPFSRGEIIPAYYLASNASYHGAKELLNRLAERGARAKIAHIPMIPLALSSGVGAKGKNGLLRLRGLGSRFVLQAIATDACAPLFYAEPVPDCGNCSLCAAACPMGAIDPEAGLTDARRCMRYDMDGPTHPDAIKHNLVQYLGCEACQHACPRNARIAPIEPPEPVRAAFDQRRLILGDAADARRLVGKNITGGGKLTAEAIVFAARSGEHDDWIGEAKAQSPQAEAVKDALRFATELREKR